MHVFYRAVLGGRVVVYEQVEPVRFCCSDMEGEWDILIGFGLRGHPLTSSREVNIFTTHPMSTGTIIPGITEITYCPWCGEVIEVIRVK